MTASSVFFTEKSTGDNYFVDDVDDLVREHLGESGDRHLFLHHWFDLLIEGIESGKSLTDLAEFFSDSKSVGPIFSWINEHFTLTVNTD